MTRCWAEVSEIVVPFAPRSILRRRPMKQMILEFGSLGLTKLQDRNILSSKSLEVHSPRSVFERPWKMKQRATYTKLRGGYYTPYEISKFLSSWAIRNPTDSILEPSCGDGAFIQAAAEKLLRVGATPKQIEDQIAGYELDPVEARKAARPISDLGVRQLTIQASDFFKACRKDLAKDRFDVVLGNPPFIRYQNFPEDQRAIAFDLMRQVGLRPNRLTNAWLPFLVCSALLLKPRGRLAMVIPAELLQVNYAAEVRLFLGNYFSQIRVLTFRKLAFQGIQQEVILLLAERGELKKKGIEVVEFDTTSQLAAFSPERFGKNGFKSIDHSTDKWTQYFLSEGEIALVRKLRSDPRLIPMGRIADTDVGVVTGMNDFFLLTPAQSRRSGLSRFTRPLVSRSNHLSGMIFHKRDWMENARLGCPVHLLDLPAVERESLSSAANRYIEEGEIRKLHEGYKCRIRKLWYIVPSVYVPTGFLLRQIHNYPKLVVNESGATCTDTIHRVRFKNGTNQRQFAAAFLNSLTFAFSELMGRSYGGGVLELEPNEADKLPIPMTGMEKLDVHEIDLYLRAGEIDRILEQTDRVLLREGMGMSWNDIYALNSIWRKLRARRIGRKVRAVPSDKSAEMGRQPLISGEVEALHAAAK
jgi:adenine-specific DNA-methyltransferase